MELDLDLIRDLLHRAALVAEHDKAAKAEARRRGEAFNVFRMCKVDHYENLHSAILAELLNPEGSHGQGDIFLRLFLESSGVPVPSGFCTENALVRTEYAMETGRLDILIDDQIGHAVIIENKIYAADQEAQLQRYDTFAREHFAAGYSMLYLTLYGSEASKNSVAGVEYTPISYQNTILGWLERCLQTVYDKASLREILIQYKKHIQQLTDQDMDKKSENELIAEMLRQPEGAAAIIKAYPTWEKTVLEETLFKALTEFADSRGLRFSVNDRFWSKNAWGHFSFEVRTNLHIVFEYEKQGRIGFFYGVTDMRPDRKERRNLPGLVGGNENWRYGWHYLEDPFRNWTMDTIVHLAKGDKALQNYIQNAVEMLFKELTDNNIL